MCYMIQLLYAFTKDPPGTITLSSPSSEASFSHLYHLTQDLLSQPKALLLPVKSMAIN